MDASNPKLIATALCSLQGVSNCVIQLGSIVGKPPKLPQKVTPIRSLHEFIFTPGGVIVNQVCGIGVGKKINLNPIEFGSFYRHTIVNANQLDPNGKPTRYTLNPVAGTEIVRENVAPGETVFPCLKNPDCHAEFKNTYQLKLHQDGGCFRKVPITTGGAETVSDYIKTIYIGEMGIAGNTMYVEPNKGQLYHREQLEKPSLSPVLLDLAVDTNWLPKDASIGGYYKLGFGLPMGSQKNKISPEAREFVEAIFKLGIGAGGDNRNVTSAEIERRMQTEELAPGQPRFQPNQFLDELQIKYLIRIFRDNMRQAERAKNDAQAQAQAQGQQPPPPPQPPQPPQPEPVDEEQQQIDEDDALVEMNAFESSMIVERTVNIIEIVDQDAREDSSEHPIQMLEQNVCQLANTIMKQRKNALSPLTHLDKRTIKYISDACGAPVYSQDLASSQTTKRLIFHDVEMIIIQYVIDNCSYCCMQAQKFA